MEKPETSVEYPRLFNVRHRQRPKGMHDDHHLNRDALRRLRYEYRVLDSVLHTTDVMLVLLDPAFNFVWVNAAYAATCQMTPEAMVGKNHFVLYPHAENEAIFRHVRDTGEAIFYKDRPFVFPDQPERGVTYWNWSLKPVKNDADVVTGLVFSLRETTRFKQAEEALHESEERFRLFMDHSPLIAWMKDAEGRHLYRNQTFEQRFGVRLADCKGKTDAELWPADIAATFRQNDLAVLAAGHPIEVIEETREPDGRRATWLSVRFPFSDATGATFVGGLALDITERQRIEQALQDSESRYRMLHESLRDPFVQVTMEGHVIDCNELYCQLLDYTSEELRALTYQDLTPERWWAFEEAIVHEQILPRGYSDIYEKEYRRKDGTLIPVELRTILARDVAGEPRTMWAIVRDISARKHLEATLHQHATRDALTGACNRRQFFKVAGDELKRARRLQHPLALAMIDLDHLKRLNDTYGHAGGDQALRALVHCGQQQLREIDVLARLGGDEFVVLLPAATPQQAYEALERIRRTLAAQPLELAGGRVAITLSAGIAGWRGASESVEKLLERADHVLYQTKQAGRNRVGVESAAGMSKGLTPGAATRSEVPTAAITPERRHAPRRAVTCRVQFHVIGNSCPTTAPGHQRAIARDLSEGGAQLVVEQTYPVQTFLVFAVADEAAGWEQLTLHVGTVVWAHPLPDEGRCALGIQFSDGAPQKRSGSRAALPPPGPRR
ncbi:MAG: diguanylate cyclase [Azonexus sp.]